MILVVYGVMFFVCVAVLKEMVDEKSENII